jgi:hypothetical protein
MKDDRILSKLKEMRNRGQEYGGRSGDCDQLAGL